MSSASGEGVLVVDDDASIRESLELHLARLGYRVCAAATGEEAIGLLAASEPALVITDVRMAGLDGFGVLELLKVSAATRDIPVLMMSAWDDAASVVRGVKGGAEDYLPKPFDIELLERRIRACLARRRVTSREELRHEIAAARRRAEPDEPEGSAIPRPLRLVANRYEILQTIGAGGTGVVYKARDRELGEDVAIKMLHPDLATRGDEAGAPAAGLKLEASFAHRVSHPNVVRTYDYGIAGGAGYVTMELVEGSTVARLVEGNRRLAVPAVLAIGLQVAEALAAAHQQHIVHGDIKPANLLLDQRGVLKVSDFGVARLRERGCVPAEAAMPAGTPAYMSPEQLFGEEVDDRSDLYAAGVVLYECLTGAPPFRAPSPIELAAQMLQERPALPATLRPEVPSALSALVMDLLATLPEKRPATAAELARLLGRIV